MLKTYFWMLIRLCADRPYNSTLQCIDTIDGDSLDEEGSGDTKGDFLILGRDNDGEMEYYCAVCNTHCHSDAWESYFTVC